MTSTCHNEAWGRTSSSARLKAIRDPRMRVLALVAAFGRGRSRRLGRGPGGDRRPGPPGRRCRRDRDARVRSPTRPPSRACPTTTAAARSTTAADRAQPAGDRAAVPDRVAAGRAAAPAREAARSRAPAAARPIAPLTLGERKALARTHRRDKLLLLIRDPHPHGRRDPPRQPARHRERHREDGRARGPAVPESLAKIAAHPRWSVRHAVKRALVLNPSTPLADAIRIATTLRAPELAELANDHSLPRAAAQARCARCSPSCDATARLASAGSTSLPFSSCGGRRLLPTRRRRPSRRLSSSLASCRPRARRRPSCSSIVLVVVDVRGLLEVLDAPPERVADARQLVGAEHDEDDEEDDD